MAKTKQHTDDEQGIKEVETELDVVFQDTWDGVEAKSFDEVPDATYQAQVIAGVINISKSASARLQCSWELVIIEGDFKGRHIFIHQGLDTEDGVSYFKGTLARLGREEPKNKKELKETLQEIIDGPTYVAVKLSTRKKKLDDGTYSEFQNKRVLKALDSDEVTTDLTDEELAPTLTAEEVEPGDENKGKGKGKDKDEDKGEDKDKGDDKGHEVPTVTLANREFTPPQRRALAKLATEDDFKVEDYESRSQLLCEIASYNGLTGKFKNVELLIKAIQKAKPKD